MNKFKYTMTNDELADAIEKANAMALSRSPDSQTLPAVLAHFEILLKIQQSRAAIIQIVELQNQQ